MSETTELWMPPALAAHMERLTVGQRVRVRLTGECGLMTRGGVDNQHYDVENGQEGEIGPCEWEEDECRWAHTTHLYFVRFQTAIHFPKLHSSMYGAHYAPHELEILDD